MMRSISKRLTAMCHCARFFFVLVLHTYNQHSVQFNIDSKFNSNLHAHFRPIFGKVEFIHLKCEQKTKFDKMKRNRLTQNSKQSKQSKISDFISQHIDKSNESIEERQNNQLSSINENGLFISFW